MNIKHAQCGVVAEVEGINGVLLCIYTSEVYVIRDIKLAEFVLSQHYARQVFCSREVDSGDILFWCQQNGDSLTVNLNSA